MKRVAFLLLLAACSDAAPTNDPAAVPGELTVMLRSSGPALGAIRFRVSGGDIAQVTGADGMNVFSKITEDGASVVAIGATLEGALVRLRVPDVRKAAQYRPEVLELVDTQNRQVTARGSYRLEVAQVP